MGALNAIWNVVTRSPAAFPPEALSAQGDRSTEMRRESSWPASAEFSRQRPMARSQRPVDLLKRGPLIAHWIGSATAPRPTRIRGPTRAALSTKNRGREHVAGYARTTPDHW